MKISKKDYKKDIAPIGFFFDIIPTELFNVPILPIPMRIDKVIKGELTYFMRFDTEKLTTLFKDLNLCIDFKSFYTNGIRNLIDYAIKNSNDIAFNSYKKYILRKWLNNSISIEIDLPDLTEDLTFILSEFLRTYSIINNFDGNDESYIEELVNYCDRIIEYFKERLDSNSFKVKYNGDYIEDKIYFTKKSKHYPKIIEIKVKRFRGGIVRDTVEKMHFVPYLIYDDLLDTFFYNKQLLTEHNQKPYNLELYKENGIILKYTNITNYSFSNNIKNANGLSNIDLEKMINDI